MSSPESLDTTDPNVLFELQMAALNAQETLMLNLPDAPAGRFGKKRKAFEHPDEIARVFTQMPPSQIAIKFHTSGSTGEPKPVPHTWRHLMGDARAIANSVGISAQEHLTTISTVPLDHMFGYSYGFMLTNLYGFNRPTKRVVSPRSLLGALQNVEHPVLLVTTPTHLRTYVESKIATFPNIRWIFCATSPLPAGLNELVMQKFGTHITDIYGCTEAGTLAYKDMSKPDAQWQCLKGISLTQNSGQFVFEADYFDEPVIIDDILNITGPGSFEFVGRSNDLVKIGGKRQSVSGLSRLVETLPNVREAKFFLPAEETNARLALFVVFNGPKNFEQIRLAMLAKVDPVFLPRQCFAIDALPYTSNGKLRLADMTILYQKLSKKAGVI